MVHFLLPLSGAAGERHSKEGEKGKPIAENWSGRQSFGFVPSSVYVCRANSENWFCFCCLLYVSCCRMKMVSNHANLCLALPYPAHTHTHPFIWPRTGTHNLFEVLELTWPYSCPTTEGEINRTRIVGTLLGTAAGKKDSVFLLRRLIRSLFLNRSKLVLICLYAQSAFFADWEVLESLHHCLCFDCVCIVVKLLNITNWMLLATIQGKKVVSVRSGASSQAARTSLLRSLVL